MNETAPNLPGMKKEPEVRALKVKTPLHHRLKVLATERGITMEEFTQPALEQLADSTPRIELNQAAS